MTQPIDQVSLAIEIQRLQSLTNDAIAIQGRIQKETQGYWGWRSEQEKKHNALIEEASKGFASLLKQLQEAQISIIAQNAALTQKTSVLSEELARAKQLAPPSDRPQLGSG